jgi:hypothetical protein
MRGRLLAAIFGVSAIVLGFSPSAAAYNWGPCDLHVTLIEPYNVGLTSTATAGFTAVFIVVDGPVGQVCQNISLPTQCATGDFLYYSPIFFGDSNSTNETIRQMANTRSMLSTVQLAMALGTKVRLFGNNKASGSSYCQITNVNSLPN